MLISYSHEVVKKALGYKVVNLRQEDLGDDASNRY